MIPKIVVSKSFYDAWQRAGFPTDGLVPDAQISVTNRTSPLITARFGSVWVPPDPSK